MCQSVSQSRFPRRIVSHPFGDPSFSIGETLLSLQGLQGNDFGNLPGMNPPPPMATTQEAERETVCEHQVVLPKGYFSCHTFCGQV
jgi:hypothetical protein